MNPGLRSWSPMLCTHSHRPPPQVLSQQYTLENSAKFQNLPWNRAHNLTRESMHLNSIVFLIFIVCFIPVKWKNKTHKRHMQTYNKHQAAVITAVKSWIMDGNKLRQLLNSLSIQLAYCFNRLITVIPPSLSLPFLYLIFHPCFSSLFSIYRMKEVQRGRGRGERIKEG